MPIVGSAWRGEWIFDAVLEVFKFFLVFRSKLDSIRVHFQALEEGSGIGLIFGNIIGMFFGDFFVHLIRTGDDLLNFPGFIAGDMMK